MREVNAGQTQDLLQRTEVLVVCSENLEPFCSEASRSSSQPPGGFDQQGSWRTIVFKNLQLLQFNLDDFRPSESGGFGFCSVSPSPTLSVSSTEPTDTDTFVPNEAQLEQKAPRPRRLLSVAALETGHPVRRRSRGRCCCHAHRKNRHAGLGLAGEAAAPTDWSARGDRGLASMVQLQVQV